MKNGQFIKCNSIEVHTNKDLAPRGDRSNMAGDDTGRASKRLFLEVIACADCGYMEEYIQSRYLVDE